MDQAETSEPISKARAGSLHELLLIALPLIISFGSQSLMNFVDRILLTWHSQTALAATMPAGMLNWAFLSFAYGIANYTGTFVAQYEGANRRDRVAAIVWQASGIALLLGSGLAMLSFAAPAIFSFMGHPPEVQVAEVTYFSTLCAGTPAVLLLTTFSGFFSGKGKTAVVMVVSLSAVAINLVLDYILIFGVGPFPALGIWGAALATVLANIFAMILFLILIIKTARKEIYPMWETMRFDASLCLRMLQYGLPMGLQMFVDVAGFAVFAFFVGRLGTAELAATNLAFNLNSLSFIPMIGLGIAVMTLVGRRIGEGRAELANQTVKHALYFGLSYMGTWCLAYLFIPRILLFPFAAFAEGEEFSALENLVIVLLRFVVVYGLFDVLAIIYGYAIRGSGDTLFPLLFFALASFFCLIVPAVVISQYWGGNLLATWTAVTSYVVVVGIGMCWRFHSGEWKAMSLVESKESE